MRDQKRHRVAVGEQDNKSELQRVADELCWHSAIYQGA